MNLLPLLTYVTLLAFFPLVTLANVEKTIFVAPPLPPAHPSTPLDDLGLDTLAPENPLLRTGLNASFPLDGRPAGEDGDSTTADSATGSVSWFLLGDLAPGVRYEVRVCWLATQPTSFTLSTHTLEEITSDKASLAAISRFSNARLSSLPEPQRKPAQAHTSNRKDQSDRDTAVLFLRIDAVADYFSLEESLMQAVPPVVVDIILDPFLGNVFPRSLVSTACWGLVVAVVAVGVSRWAVREIGRVVLHEMRSSTSSGAKDSQKKTN